MAQPFSRRHGYHGVAPEITIREGVTDYVRHYGVVGVINGNTFTAHTARNLVCRIVRTVPDTNNWSEGNVRRELDDLVAACEWWKVYDIIEAIYGHLEPQIVSPADGLTAGNYATLINEMFVEEGIGWKLEGGSIVARGGEEFERITKAADAILTTAKRVTARDRLNEAFHDLSRRPNPDLAGAIIHSVGALECVARDVTDDLKLTAGEIIKKHPDLIPKPLGNSIASIWGYSSNVARHVTEGQVLSFDEAELILGLSASVCTFLSRKFPKK